MCQVLEQDWKKNLQVNHAKKKSCLCRSCGHFESDPFESDLCHFQTRLTGLYGLLQLNKKIQGTWLDRLPETVWLTSNIPVFLMRDPPSIFQKAIWPLPQVTIVFLSQGWNSAAKTGSVEL